MERDFYAMLDQVLVLLRSRGRVTYNALKLQFHLDDAYLAVLKEELLYAYPQVIDDAGRGLIWTGAPAVVPTSAQADTVPVPPAMAVRPPPEAERRQLTVLFCDLVGSLKKNLPRCGPRQCGRTPCLPPAGGGHTPQYGVGGRRQM